MLICFYAHMPLCPYAQNHIALAGFQGGGCIPTILFSQNPGWMLYFTLLYLLYLLTYLLTYFNFYALRSYAHVAARFHIYLFSHI